MNIYQASMRLTELKLAREAEGKPIDIDQIDVDVLETGEELFAAVYWKNDDYNMVCFEFPAGITPTNFDSSVVRDMLLNYPSTAMH